MRVIILLSLVVFTGCFERHEKKPNSVHEVIREVRNLNYKTLENLSIFVREGSYDDVKMQFSDFHYSPKTKHGFMTFEDGKLQSIRYDRWQGPKINSKALNQIQYYFCEIGLASLKVDSCGNKYFTFFDHGKYREFFLVKNKVCLTKRDTLNCIVID